MAKYLSTVTKLELDEKKREIFELKTSIGADVEFSHDNNEVLSSLPEAMHKVRDEITETMAALKEARLKTASLHPNDKYSDIANISADLIVRLAELEVSRANLLSSLPFFEFSESAELVELRANLADARKDLFKFIRELDFDLSFVESNNLVKTQTQKVDFFSVSPLKLDYVDGYMENAISARNQNSPEIQASNMIVENVNEMKNVLNQFKEIISSGVSKRSADFHNVGLKTASITPTHSNIIEKWNPPLMDGIVLWSRQKRLLKHSSVISPKIILELVRYKFGSFLIFCVFNHFKPSFFILCTSICSMLTKYFSAWICLTFIY